MASQSPWPVKEAYDDAILQRATTVFDPDIRDGKLAMDAGDIRHYGGANLYVRLYRVSDWMVRCFCSDAGNAPPDDIIKRYQAIDRFYQAHHDEVPALLTVKYLEEGIRIQSRMLPLVKMHFCEAPRLGLFILHNYSNSACMHQLCNAWLSMIRGLEKARIAHGDLDLTNVLVQEQGSTLNLKLIDYDNLWIPDLAGFPQTEHGHEHFQHPAYVQPHARPYNVKMGRFSALVIYLSLEILVTHPHLYDDWTADDASRLLLSQNDYAEYLNDPLANGRLAQLYILCRSTRPELVAYVGALQRSLTQGCMPPSLDQIAGEYYALPRPPRYNFNKAILADQLPTPVAVHKMPEAVIVDSRPPLPTKTNTTSVSKRVLITVFVVTVLLIIVGIIVWIVLSIHNYTIPSRGDLVYALFSHWHYHVAQVQSIKRIL